MGEFRSDLIFKFKLILTACRDVAVVVVVVDVVEVVAGGHLQVYISFCQVGEILSSWVIFSQNITFI